MPRYPDIHVHLVGQDGNIFAIIGRVSRALKKARVSREEIDEFQMQTMTAGSYDDALRTVMGWVATDDPDHAGYGDYQ